MNPITPQAFPANPAVPSASELSDARLHAAAEQLEAGFLTEMLRAAGAGATRTDFGGGAGEEQFSSFLLEAQAREMVRAGGIGLAESLFEAMKMRNGNV